MLLLGKFKNLYFFELNKNLPIGYKMKGKFMNQYEQELKEFLESDDSNFVPVVFLFVGLTIGILEIIKQTRENLLKGNNEQCSK